MKKTIGAIENHSKPIVTVYLAMKVVKTVISFIILGVIVWYVFHTVLPERKVRSEAVTTAQSEVYQKYEENQTKRDEILAKMESNR